VQTRAASSQARLTNWPSRIASSGRSAPGEEPKSNRTRVGLDAVLTLNSAVAAVAVSAAQDAGSKATIATFDLNQDVIKGIKNGSIAFAVDQQQYEQGYLPIVMLQLYVKNLNTVGGGQPVLTGPGIVDKKNVDEIAEKCGFGTRESMRRSFQRILRVSPTAYRSRFAE